MQDPAAQQNAQSPQKNTNWRPLGLALCGLGFLVLVIALIMWWLSSSGGYDVGQSCQLNSDCQSNYCCNQVCSATTCPPQGKRLGRSCKKNSECQSTYCCNSVCSTTPCSPSPSPKAPSPQACAETSQCPSGYYCCNDTCSANRCIAGDYCTERSDCGTSYYCATRCSNTACAVGLACSGNSDCQTNYCFENSCKIPGSGNANGNVGNVGGANATGYACETPHDYLWLVAKDNTASTSARGNTVVQSIGLQYTALEDLSPIPTQALCTLDSYNSVTPDNPLPSNPCEGSYGTQIFNVGTTGEGNNYYTLSPGQNAQVIGYYCGSALVDLATVDTSTFALWSPLSPSNANCSPFLASMSNTSPPSPEMPSSPTWVQTNCKLDGS